mmetsp:Transcript_32714/g.108169  ORF Transcript_32714/g.108169 Transcript_32714/m.108169 type:complete len:513 (-) Transcript_32714:521-2059(-)
MYVAQVQQVSLLVIKYTIANSSWPLRNGLCLRASEGLAGLLLEHKLLHLAARRQREPVDDAEELGHLEMRQLAPTQRLDGLDDGRVALLRAALRHWSVEHDAGADLLSVGRVVDADDGDVVDVLVPQDDLLNLHRRDVLAAANDDVLAPPRDGAVPLRVESREVSGPEEAIRRHDLPRRRLVAPVAPAHDRVPAREQLALLAHRPRLAALGADDLALHVRVDVPHGRAELLRVEAAAAERGGDGLEGDGAGLGHAVAHRQVRHVHVSPHPRHGRDRAERARHDAGAERREVERAEVREGELRKEHRRHAIQRAAPLLLHRLQRRARVECARREDDGGAGGDARERAKHEAEAVEQRHRQADGVVRRQPHAAGHKTAVVDDVAVCQSDRLRQARRPRCELDVGHVFVRQRRRRRRCSASFLEPVAAQGRGGEALVPAALPALEHVGVGHRDRVLQTARRGAAAGPTSAARECDDSLERGHGLLGGLQQPLHHCCVLAPRAAGAEEQRLDAGEP